MKTKVQYIVLILIIFAGVSGAQNTQPGITLQGVLRDQMNRAVPDGDYGITFSIYTQKNGGTPLWTSTLQSVPVKEGTFSSSLKDFSPQVTFSQQYFVGLTVDGFGGELNPRIELTASPYAHGIVGGENKIAGDGNIGIGTLQPTEKLEVDGNMKVSGYLETGDSIALNSNIRFKQGSGGIFDNNDKPLVQQQYSSQTGEILVFKPGGSTNSANSFLLSDTKGLEPGENMPVIMNDASINLRSSLSGASEGVFRFFRSGFESDKNVMIAQIEKDNSNFVTFDAGENTTHTYFNAGLQNVGIGKIPHTNAKLDVDGSIFVNGILPFEYKEFQGAGIEININTNYDSEKWIGLFAGHNPTAFDINEYESSGIRQYCYIKNGTIWVRSRLPGHITVPIHRVYVMFVRKEFISGVNPNQ